VGSGVTSAADVLADGTAEDSPVAVENVAAEVSPAKVSEASGPPSWPSTTGVVAPEPATTGIAITREVTTVLRQMLSASRPPRWPDGRPAADARRLDAPVRRAERGGTSGEWCTKKPHGVA
jgi:hypothetical protein